MCSEGPNQFSSVRRGLDPGSQIGASLPRVFDIRMLNYLPMSFLTLAASGYSLILILVCIRRIITAKGKPIQSSWRRTSGETLAPQITTATLFPR